MKDKVRNKEIKIVVVRHIGERYRWSQTDRRERWGELDGRKHRDVNEEVG